MAEVIRTSERRQDALMPELFSNVRQHDGSQKSGFEELVCQAVRRTDAAGKDTWRRLHGAGGDGGVEAYWFSALGAKIGVQAKWFLKSGDIAWGQVESSFKTAVDVHKDLVEYRIYLACDLTGSTRRGTRTGVDDWDDCQKRLEAHAHKKGRDVRLLLISASELYALLADPRCVGLTDYWLGGFELTREKLDNWLLDAARELRERYHPEDHVDMDAQEIFHGLARDRALLSDVEEVGVAASDCQLITAPAHWTAPGKELVREANQNVRALSRATSALAAPLDQPLPTEAWKKAANAVIDTSREVVSHSYSTDPPRRGGPRKRTAAETSTSDLNALRHYAFAIGDVASRLETLLRSRRFRAEATRAAVLIGAAGAGKSHLLAAALKAELEAGGTAFLFLGHWFQNARVWEEIQSRLGFTSGSQRDLLGVIDARAASIGRRAIIAIDAVNESSEANWPRQLAALVSTVLEFPNIAVIVSCRDVYEPHVISEDVYNLAARFEVRGFQSEQEQESAARQFLDKRGITRPAMPWLAPEFANPLFLRTCALALQLSGKTEFPDGLTGAKAIFGFFLKAISKTIATDYDSAEVGACVPRALLALAKAIALQRSDSLGFAEAKRIVDEAFEGRASSTTWLDVLCRSGLLDKFPDTASADPSGFVPASYRVRFSYQRLQDHLMAEALLAGYTTLGQLEAGAEPLAFIFDRYGGVDWRFIGLLNALSIQVPERFGAEFRDVVTHWTGRYHLGPDFDRAFVQSVKWRDPSHISDRTLDLATEIADDDRDVLLLLVELSLRTAHPLNAERLHELLRPMNMPARDRIWSRLISSEYVDSACWRLVRWSADADRSKVSRQTLRLAAIAVTWMLAASSRPLRDSATKSLSSLFVDDPGIFPMLTDRFASVDDPYILERLLAAAYGYALRAGSDEDRRVYASVAAQLVFAPAKPVPHLHLRAYARGLVELAVARGVYDGAVALEKCRPPYGSTKPRFDVTKERMEEIAKKAGDARILRSCGEWGDFKRYEVASALGYFVRVPLSSPKPMTGTDRIREFEHSIAGREAATSLLAEFREAWSEYLSNVLEIRILRLGAPKEEEEPQPNPKAVAATRAWALARDRLLGSIETELGPEDFRRFKTEWLAHFESPGGRELPMFDPEKAGLWIARRAYALGWTAKKFPNDGSEHMHRSGSRPPVERIGKKYQWIARSGLFARLADNYWIHRQYSDSEAQTFGYPTDLGYERDVEATIFPHHTFNETAAAPEFLRLSLSIEAREGLDRLRWPFRESPAQACMSTVRFVDAGGTSWTKLSWYEGHDRKRKRSDGGDHGYQQQTFWFLRTFLAKEADALAVQKHLIREGRIDIQQNRPPEFVGHAFVYETHLPGVWPDLFQQEHQPAWPDGPAVAASRPVEELGWERHLDASLSKSVRIETLASWIMSRCALRRDTADPHIVRDRSGAIIGRHVEAEHRWGTVIRTDFLQRLLKDQGLQIAFLVIGEREGWGEGDHEEAFACRRFNGIAVGLENIGKANCWNEDQTRGVEL
jgi:hypothetical protein